MPPHTHTRTHTHKGSHPFRLVCVCSVNVRRLRLQTDVTFLHFTFYFFFLFLFWVSRVVSCCLHLIFFCFLCSRFFLDKFLFEFMHMCVSSACVCVFVCMLQCQLSVRTNALLKVFGGCEGHDWATNLWRGLSTIEIKISISILMWKCACGICGSYLYDCWKALYRYSHRLSILSYR